MQYKYTNPLCKLGPKVLGGKYMREFTMLIGQIGFIALLEMALEMFIDPKEKPHHVKLLKLACIMGSLYLLLQFAHDYLINTIAAFITF